MDGPEYLQDDRPRPRRPRSWVVLGAVLLVVAGLTVHRVAGLDPARTPTTRPTTPPPGASRGQGWPAASGAGRGSLFLSAGGRVQVIDASSGLLSRTAVEIDPAAGRLVPIGGGVLVTPHNGRERQLLLVPDESGFLSRGLLRTANAFLPGPGFAVWAATLVRGEPAPATRWRLVSDDGRVGVSVLASGDAVADGSGGLLEVGRTGVRRLYPSPVGPRRPGAVLAVGPDGYLVRRCTGSACTDTLHQRADTAADDLPQPLTAGATGGALSPSNRFAALTASSGAAAVEEIVDVGSGRVLRSFPAAGAAGSPSLGTAWLTDRWVVLVSVDRLVLYDAEDDAVVVPDLPLSSIAQLVWQPT